MSSRIKILVLLLLIVLVGLLIPNFSLVGEDVTIYLNKEYNEPGFNASILGIDLSKNVSVTNDIDTSKVGYYKVKYELKYIFKYTKTRYVRVVEDKPPVISLKGEDHIYLCPNIEYKELGYTAYDDYDKDITSNVMTYAKDDYILYSVLDSSHNIGEAKRYVYNKDTIKPEITLNGNDVYLLLNQKYNEQGYKAYDNCLGDITDKVTVTNNVDTSKVGSYKITYTVSDGENETTIYRNVYVISNNSILGGDNLPGVIYLTFDDGPGAYTERLLNILDKYNVKATFFVVPKNASRYSTIKRAYDSGHSIGIHSMSHVYSEVYKSLDSLISDIEGAGNIIKNITGEYPYLYRYPGGSSNTVSRTYTKGIITASASLLHQKGYHYFDWNISSADANGGKNPSYVTAGNVTRQLSHNRANVVLMHDIYYTTVEAVEDIIKYGIANGYTFSKITLNTMEVHHRIAN